MAEAGGHMCMAGGECGGGACVVVVVYAWQGVCMVGCVCMAGGMCGGGVHGGGHAWQGACVAGGHACVAGEMPLQWAVRILLECILVFEKF